MALWRLVVQEQNLLPKVLLHFKVAKLKLKKLHYGKVLVYIDFHQMKILHL